MHRLLIFILAAGFVVSCSQKRAVGEFNTTENSSGLVPPPQTDPPTPPDEQTQILLTWKAWWTEENPNNPEYISWSHNVLSEIQSIAGPSLVAEPKDIADYCPKWSSLSLIDRKGFYLSLISAMAKFESDFDPKSQYKENFKDANGRWVISRGLLQLSEESANAYGCKVTAQSLHDPQTNLTCGIQILNRWIAKDSYFGSSTGSSKTNHMGGARYWAVLRSKSSSQKKIQAFTKSQKQCQVGP